MSKRNISFWFEVKIFFSVMRSFYQDSDFWRCREPDTSSDMKFQLRSSQIKTLSICATNFFLVAGYFRSDPPTQLQIQKSKIFLVRRRFLSRFQQGELQPRLSKAILLSRTDENEILIERWKLQFALIYSRCQKKSGGAHTQWKWRFHVLSFLNQKFWCLYAPMHRSIELAIVSECLYPVSEHAAEKSRFLGTCGQVKLALLWRSQSWLVGWSPCIFAREWDRLSQPFCMVSSRSKG